MTPSREAQERATALLADADDLTRSILILADPPRTASEDLNEVIHVLAMAMSEGRAVA